MNYYFLKNLKYFWWTLFPAQANAGLVDLADPEAFACAIFMHCKNQLICRFVMQK